MSFYLQVAPLEKELVQSQKELQSIKGELRESQTELQSLERKFDDAILEKSQLQKEVEVMERRRIAADKLISGLSSENEQ